MIFIKPPYLIIGLFFLVGVLSYCKSPTAGNKSFHQGSVISKDSNNVLKMTSANTLTGTNTQDKIIFKGKNNLFELVQKNSTYFDEHHDIIIIKGNNSIIKLINIKIVDLRPEGIDTLIIVGNNQKYVMEVRETVSIKSKKFKTEVIHLEETTFDVSPFTQENIAEDKPVKLDYFDSLVSVKYAFAYFTERLNTGEPEYFYQLAEMYLYGLGVNESNEKAIELYEFAAAKDHINSLIKLGNIFSGTFSVKKDKNKTLYYYKRCQALGNSYCDEKVKEMK